MSRSVHDNLVYAELTQYEDRRIVLFTKFRDGVTPEYTDVEFRGVVARLFEHELPGNILFGIDEVDLAGLCRANAEVFTRGKRYGWPHPKHDDLEDLIANLAAQGVRAYEISSSCGLSGWVLAEAMRLLTRPVRMVH